MPKGWRWRSSWPHFVSLKSVRVGRAINRWRCPWPPMEPTSLCWLRWHSSSAGTPAVWDLGDLEAPVQGSPSRWEPHLRPSWVPCGSKGINWPSLQVVLRGALPTAAYLLSICKCSRTAVLLPLVSLLCAFLLCFHCSASWTWLHILNQPVFCKLAFEMVMK